MIDWLDEHHDGIHSAMRRVSIAKVDDSGDYQRLTLKGYASEEFKNVVRAHDHGFASNPPEGSMGLLLPIGMRSDHAHAIGFEHQKYRQKNLPGGAAALYDSKGNVIKLFTGDGVTVTTAAGNTLIETKNGKVTIDASGNVYVNAAQVFLGSKDGSGCARVMTESGPSANVFAKV